MVAKFGMENVLVINPRMNLPNRQSETCVCSYNICNYIIKFQGLKQRVTPMITLVFWMNSTMRAH